MIRIALVTNNPSYEAMVRNRLNLNGVDKDMLLEKVQPEVLAGNEFPDYDVYIIRYDDGFTDLSARINKLQFVTKNKYGKRSAVIVVADNTAPPPPVIATFNANWIPLVRTVDLSRELLGAVPLLRMYEPQSKLPQKFYDEQTVLAKQYRVADRLDLLSKVCWFVIILGGLRLILLL